MHQNDSRPAPFDGSARIRNVGQRLTAKGTPRMTQEYQENGRACRQIDQTLTRLCQRAIENAGNNGGVEVLMWLRFQIFIRRYSYLRLPAAQGGRTKSS